MFPGISREIDELKEKLFESLRQQVKIPSVEGAPAENAPFGPAVAEALDHVLALGASLGFEAENHGGYVGTIDWGEGKELLGILAHVDVVPPGDLSAWETPPYEMTETDGMVRGRGVADDKGPLLSSLYGMYALKKTGFRPNKRVRIIVGTNEETGWGCMKYYTAHCETPTMGFSPDGMFTVVNREKGILSLALAKKLPGDLFSGISMEGGEAVNLVPAAASARLAMPDKERLAALKRAAESLPETLGSVSISEKDGNLFIAVKGKSAHAMTPEKGVNAIGGLFRLLVSPGCLSDREKEELETVLNLLGDQPDGNALGLACSDEVSGGLTLNLGMFRLSGGELTLRFDMRTPVTCSIEELAGRLVSRFEREGYAKTEERIKKPLYVPADSPLIQKLCGVYEKVTGEKSVLYSIGGGTYARAFPNCVCFGSVYPGEELTVHSPNERTAAANILRNAKMYGLAVYELTK